MIVKADLVSLYNRTLQTYNRDPKDGELDAWLNVLGGYRAPDLDAALRRWQSDALIEDFTRRPRGARMPTAVELKISIDTFERANSEEFQCCDKCENGWIRVFEGKTYRGNPVDPKIGALKRCQCFMDWAATRRKSA